ncbi:1,4-alpha-glucan branching protein GlgB [Hansschlegelia beijingensis]|uniref:1,4-alpha-glucan branching enzyme GlgB n=1 Tax=Hansschlegelia beijingensis TaxID=1133344 RepID=A0A7W6GE22_9HYPH|nr:1,4-alpha-glucan branching protein GlgB [Hansschlegelia beijingensis]MBB3971750.1 1,4-alpha-glucan branching enzyme [Hansschlegelia beijingensis]
MSVATTSLNSGALAALADGTHGDPFGALGRRDDGDGPYVRAVLPGAASVEVVSRDDRRPLGVLREIEGTGVFEGPISGVDPYLLRIEWPGGVQETEDPYSFGLLLGDLDLHLLGESRHFELASALGANPMTIDGVEGVRFAVWAPNARRVSVIGDFNSWDSRRHGMRRRLPSGVWEIFVPRLRPGERYKFALIGPDGSRLPDKADPIARSAEKAPGTASIVASAEPYAWTDHEWMARRGERQAPEAPLSFYEVHLGSWMKPNGREVDWSFAIEKLIPYVADLGFTHIELLPVAEHPFGGSWGYQPLGLFAPTGRYGAPEDFARFVDAAHAAGIGVVVDWVPAHFPTDSHGLYRFDGTALYEHADPREGFHIDWNTAIYNFGRREVQNFLIASGLFWLERFHVDGLRVDAVASMLYRDYSRKAGEWIPNQYGGRENLEAVAFLQHMNAVVRERVPSAMTIAEESTAWPGVTRPTEENGLGFHYKWNMGWMHDTLHYMQQNPIYRQYDHDGITFGLVYAFSEKFVLPLSHDEVVHGKGSLLGKMPGDAWQKFANLRALYGLMWTHPGKKLLFMGGEIAQGREWNHDDQLDWPALDNPNHAGVQRLIRDLNRVYAAEGALHAKDAEPAGFRWMIGDDRANSVFAFLRYGEAGAPPVLVVANMTPVPRHGYRIGVPTAGVWREIINTDAEIYGGSNVGNGGAVPTVEAASHGEQQALDLTLPPLGVVALRPA